MSPLAAMLPGPVAFSETRRLPLRGEEELYEVEARHVRDAVERRRLEFAAGRSCARRALTRLGLPPLPIPVGEGGAPEWPAGTVGSITHCQGYCAAAVSLDREVGGMGIDVEENAPLDPGVAERVAAPAERAAVPPDDAVAWPALLFSARESVFKVWFPITGRWLGFHDVRLDLDVEAGRFAVRPSSPAADRGRLAEVRGRFAWSEAHVFTCAWLPAGPLRSREARSSDSGA